MIDRGWVIQATGADDVPCYFTINEQGAAYWTEDPAEGLLFARERDGANMSAKSLVNPTDWVVRIVPFEQETEHGTSHP